MITDASTLATIASIISAFGVSMLFFRIQREIQMQTSGEIVWLPLADWLLVIATLICLLLVILPITFNVGNDLAAAGSAAATVMVAGYVFAILAHYRIFFGRRFIVFGEKRKGPRTNPEPSELGFVMISIAVACLVFAMRIGALKLYT